MAPIGLGKGPGQFNHDFLGCFLVQDLVGDAAQTDSTGCMGTGRTDHDRPDDVKYVHDNPPLG